eukprot:5461381-Pleurochrysis_carterae.AAC.1
MAKAQPVPRPQRGLLARARRARRGDGLRERRRASASLASRPASLAGNAEGTSGGAALRFSGGVGKRGGAALAMGSEGGVGRYRDEWNVPITLAMRKLKSGG